MSWKVGRKFAGGASVVENFTRRETAVGRAWRAALHGGGTTGRARRGVAAGAVQAVQGCVGGVAARGGGWSTGALFACVTKFCPCPSMPGLEVSVASVVLS